MAVYKMVDMNPYSVVGFSRGDEGEDLHQVGWAIYSVEASADIRSEKAIYVVDIEASTDIGGEGANYRWTVRPSPG